MHVAKTVLGAFFLTAVIVAAAAYQEHSSKVPEPVPVRFIGERLVYKIEWDPPWLLFFLPKMEAGEAQLQLTGDSEYNGRKALKIVLKGHSSGSLAKVAKMKIEDEFGFYLDPDTFCTMSSYSRIREGKRKRQVDVQYLRETRQLHIKEADESVNPPIIRRDETKDNIPECVHNPFSALYLFRDSDLRPQYTQTYTLANDDKFKEVKATVEKQENPSGKMAVWKIGVTSLMGGLFKEGGQFKLWLSADEKREPVQFEVKVKLGRVIGTLKK